MPQPTIDDVVTHLREVADVDPDLDAPIQSVGIDSLDLVEWMFILEEEYGVTADDDQLEEMQNSSVRDIHAWLIRSMQVTA